MTLSMEDAAHAHSDPNIPSGAGNVNFQVQHSEGSARSLCCDKDADDPRAMSVCVIAGKTK